MASFLSACSLFIATGCLESAEDALVPATPYPEENSGDEKMTVRFNTYVTSDISRSSGIPANDIVISIYENGMFADSLVLGDRMSGETSLEYGKFYRYYATANIPQESLPLTGTEDEMRGCRAEVHPGEQSGSIPMSASGGFTVTGDGITIEIILERLYSKLNFSMDFSGVPGLEVKSVRIRQAATSVELFSESRALSTADGARASADAVAALNDGKEIELFIPENCQGVLLPDNADSSMKVPDNIPGKADVCTYLEVEGEFSGKGALRGEIVYRFYLGQDATSDFNVRRNTSMDIRLVPSVQPDGGDSWQVDSGNLYGDVPAFILGRSGEIYYRTGGKTGYATTERESSWVKAIRGDGIYAAAANNLFRKSCSIWTSYDGIHWEKACTFYNLTITDMAYGNGIFIVLTGTNTVLVSESGKYWIAVNASADMETVTFADGKFVGVSSFSSKVYSSADGVEWTGESLFSILVSLLEYGDSEFLGIISSGIVFKSEDGKTWTRYEYSFNKTGVLKFNSLAYGNGIYALATGDSIYYSTDGISWTHSDMPAEYRSCTVDFHNGIFCAGCLSGHNELCIATSLDGKHWTTTWNSGINTSNSGICILD